MEIKDFIGAVATTNGDPFRIEDEEVAEQIKGIFDDAISIEEKTFILTEHEEWMTMCRQLDIGEYDAKAISVVRTQNPNDTLKIVFEEDFYNDDEKAQHYMLANVLHVVDTTDAPNGYPSRLVDAIVGFETFEEAKEAQRVLGGSIRHLKKKDGWNVYVRGNEAYDAYEMNAEDLGYNLEFSSDMEEFKKFADDEVKEMVSDLDFDEAFGYLSALKKIEKEVEGLDEDEVLFANAFYDGNYDTVVMKKSCMSYSYDAWEYVIGLIIEKD